MAADGDYKTYVGWSLAVPGVAIAAAATALDGVARQIAVGVCLIATLVYVVTAVRFADRRRRDRLARSLATPAFFYRLRVRRIRKWPRDWRLYDFALRLAVAYPFLLALGAWGFGQPILLDGALIAPTVVEWYFRLLAVSLLIPSVFFVLAMHVESIDFPCNLAMFALWIAAVFFLFASTYEAVYATAGAIAVLLAASASGAAASLASFAIASIFASAFGAATVVEGGIRDILALAGADGGQIERYSFAGFFLAFAATATFTAPVAIASGFAGSIALSKARSCGFARAGYVIWTFALLACLAAAALLLPLEELSRKGRMLIVFLAVLPILNALVDALSYRITLELIARGSRSGRSAFLYGLLDLAIALVLFTALGLLLIAAFAALERLSGVALLPLGPIFADLAAGDWRAHAWIITMVFSTLLPTLLHATMACFALPGLFPRWWRKGLAAWARSADGGVQAGFVAVYALLTTLAIVAVPGAVAGLLLGIATWAPGIGECYLSLFTWWAALLGAS